MARSIGSRTALVTSDYSSLSGGLLEKLHSLHSVHHATLRDGGRSLRLGHYSDAKAVLRTPQ